MISIKEQMINAVGEAMEKQRAFSWIKSRDVQQGVYIKHTQDFFKKYQMNK